MILVDMEMPKSCRFCHLQDVCVPFQREVVTEVVSIDTLNERHKDCPIKSEIPEGATNGDVIKALFNRYKWNEYKNDNGELMLVDCDEDDFVTYEVATIKAESEEDDFDNLDSMLEDLWNDTESEDKE